MNVVSIAVSVLSFMISCISFRHSKQLINNRSQITESIFQDYREKIKKEFASFESEDLSLNIELQFCLIDDKFRTNEDILISDLYNRKVINVENLYNRPLFDCCRNGSKKDIDIFEKYLSIKRLYADVIFLAIKNYFIMRTKESQDELADKKRKLKKLLVSEI